MGLPTLLWADVAGGRPFHAALVPVDSGTRQIGYHRHDGFHELFLVLEGHGTHWVSGQALPLSAGDVVLVRPHDEHAFRTERRGGMDVVNVAFPTTAWHTFTELAGSAGWDGEPWPVAVSGAGAHVIARFRAALESYARGSGALEVVRLWAEVLPLLEHIGAIDRRPAWLTAACAAMAAEENLRAGLPRLRTLAAVSDGHLARSMAVHQGCTPIAFVTGCRLDHAASLLTTTTEPVGRIAHRCGFGSQSYFTRLFHERFGHPPREHRERGRRAVVP